MDTQTTFPQRLGAAALQCLHILSALVVAPYKFWAKSVDRLCAMKQDSYLDIRKMDSELPVFAFVKRWAIDALSAFVSFLSYPVGIVVCVMSLVNSGFGDFAEDLLLFYILPLLVWLLVDILEILVVKPLAKFLSWVGKPAEHLDLTITNK